MSSREQKEQSSTKEEAKGIPSPNANQNDKKRGERRTKRAGS